MLSPAGELSIASNFSSGDAVGFVPTGVTVALRSKSPSPTLPSKVSSNRGIDTTLRPEAHPNSQVLKALLPGSLLWSPTPLTSTCLLPVKRFEKSQEETR